MRAVALLSLMVLVACGGTSNPTATATSARTSAAAPSQTVIQSAAPDPTPVTAGGSVLTLPPLWAAPTASAGQCDLPVSWNVPDGTSRWQAGFFLYPGGPMYASAPMPSSIANTGTYDRAAGRFLPAPPEAISPDGLSFAYADYDLPPSPQAGMAGQTSPHEAGPLATTGRVHLVDARTGGDRILFEGAPTYRVVGYTADGIYLTQVDLSMDGAFPHGLYRMSTSGGRPVAVAGGDRPLDRGGWTVTNGAAWGVDYSTGGGLAGGNQLVRLDLTTGAVQVWMTRPEGTSLALIGFEGSGGALVLAYAGGYSSTGSPAPTPATEVWSVGTPGATGRLIYRSTDTGAATPGGPAFPDAQGAWFGGLQSAVWLENGDTLSKVNLPVNAVIGVSGSCV
jgi:hypothetical protein